MQLSRPSQQAAGVSVITPTVAPSSSSSSLQASSPNQVSSSSSLKRADVVDTQSVLLFNSKSVPTSSTDDEGLHKSFPGQTNHFGYHFGYARHRPNSSVNSSCNGPACDTSVDRVRPQLNNGFSTTGSVLSTIPPYSRNSASTSVILPTSSAVGSANNNCAASGSGKEVSVNKLSDKELSNCKSQIEEISYISSLPLEFQDCSRFGTKDSPFTATHVAARKYILQDHNYGAPPPAIKSEHRTNGAVDCFKSPASPSKSVVLSRPSVLSSSIGGNVVQQQQLQHQRINNATNQFSSSNVVNNCVNLQTSTSIIKSNSGSSVTHINKYTTNNFSNHQVSAAINSIINSVSNSGTVITYINHNNNSAIKKSVITSVNNNNNNSYNSDITSNNTTPASINRTPTKPLITSSAALSILNGASPISSKVSTVITSNVSTVISPKVSTVISPNVSTIISPKLSTVISSNVGVAAAVATSSTITVASCSNSSVTKTTTVTSPSGGSRLNSTITTAPFVIPAASGTVITTASSGAFITATSTASTDSADTTTTTATTTTTTNITTTAAATTTNTTTTTLVTATFPKATATATTTVTKSSEAAHKSEESDLSEDDRTLDPQGEETETAPEAEGAENSVTRCVCDFLHDDGYMISCDKCFAWQHVDCMGLTRASIPEEYMCERCQPRFIDKERAIRIQKEKLANKMCVGIDSEASYTSESSVDNRKKTRRKGKGRKPQRRKSKTTVAKDDNKDSIAKNQSSSSTSRKSRQNSINSVSSPPASPVAPQADDAEKKKQLLLERKKMLLEKKQETKQRSMRKQALSVRRNQEKSPKVTEETPKPPPNNKNVNADEEIINTSYDSNASDVQQLRQWIDSYEEAVTNHYSQELRARLAAVKINGVHSESRLLTTLSALSKCKVSLLATGYKILLASDNLSLNQPIIELRGKYMWTGALSFKQTNISLNSPHVFFYTLPKEEIEICVDCRTYGNDARFVRHSCKPNAELRHCVEKTSLHLYLVATIPVIKKTEILIGHYSPDTASSCACGSPANCQARKIKYPPLTAVKNNRITSTASVVKENSRQHSPPSRSGSPVLQPRSNRRDLKDKKDQKSTKNKAVDDKVVTNASASATRTKRNTVAAKHSSPYSSASSSSSSGSGSSDEEDDSSSSSSSSSRDSSPSLPPRLPTASYPKPSNSATLVRLQHPHVEETVESPPSSISRSSVGQQQQLKQQQPQSKQQTQQQQPQSKQQPQQQQQSKQQTQQQQQSKQQTQQLQQSKQQTQQLQPKQQTQQQLQPKQQTQPQQLQSKQQTNNSGSNGDNIGSNVSNNESAPLQQQSQQQQQQQIVQQKSPTTPLPTAESPLKKQKQVRQRRESQSQQSLPQQTNSQQSMNNHKMSREDRKIMAIMKVFEQMEKGNTKSRPATQKPRGKRRKSETDNSVDENKEEIGVNNNNNNDKESNAVVKVTLKTEDDASTNKKITNIDEKQSDKPISNGSLKVSEKQESPCSDELREDEEPPPQIDDNSCLSTGEDRLTEKPEDPDKKNDSNSDVNNFSQDVVDEMIIKAEESDERTATTDLLKIDTDVSRVKSENSRDNFVNECDADDIVIKIEKTSADELSDKTVEFHDESEHSSTISLSGVLNAGSNELSGLDSLKTEVSSLNDDCPCPPILSDAKLEATTSTSLFASMLCDEVLKEEEEDEDVKKLSQPIDSKSSAVEECTSVLQNSDEKPTIAANVEQDCDIIVERVAVQKTDDESSSSKVIDSPEKQELSRKRVNSESMDSTNVSDKAIKIKRSRKNSDDLDPEDGDQVRPSDRLKSRQTTPTGDNDNSSALSEESDSVVKSKSPQAKKQSVRRGRPPESKNKKSSTPKKEAKAESPQKEFAVPKARKTPSKESPKKASSSTVVATNETGDDENDSSDEEFLPSSRGGRNRKRRGGHTGGRGRNARGGVAAGGRKNIQRTRKSPESPGSPEPTTRTTRASARNKRIQEENFVIDYIYANNDKPLDDVIPRHIDERVMLEKLKEFSRYSNDEYWLQDDEESSNRTIMNDVNSGNAKKRWLRQAISEEPQIDSGRTSPSGEYNGPFKKRRVARESVSSEASSPTTANVPNINSSLQNAVDKTSVNANKTSTIDMKSVNKKLSFSEYQQRKCNILSNSANSDHHVGSAITATADVNSTAVVAATAAMDGFVRSGIKSSSSSSFNSSSASEDDEGDKTEPPASVANVIGHASQVIARSIMLENRLASYPSAKTGHSRKTVTLETASGKISITDQKRDKCSTTASTSTSSLVTGMTSTTTVTTLSATSSEHSKSPSSAAPPQQRENLTERLRREFGLQLKDDEEKAAAAAAAAAAALNNATTIGGADRSGLNQDVRTHHTERIVRRVKKTGGKFICPPPPLMSPLQAPRFSPYPITNAQYLREPGLITNIVRAPLPPVIATVHPTMTITHTVPPPALAVAQRVTYIATPAGYHHPPPLPLPHHSQPQQQHHHHHHPPHHLPPALVPSGRTTLIHIPSSNPSLPAHIINTLPPPPPPPLPPPLPTLPPPPPPPPT